MSEAPVFNPVTLGMLFVFFPSARLLCRHLCPSSSPSLASVSLNLPEQVVAGAADNVLAPCHVTRHEVNAQFAAMAIGRDVTVVADVNRAPQHRVAGLGLDPLFGLFRTRRKAIFYRRPFLTGRRARRRVRPALPAFLSPPPKKKQDDGGSDHGRPPEGGISLLAGDVRFGHSKSQQVLVHRISLPCEH